MKPNDPFQAAAIFLGLSERELLVLMEEDCPGILDEDDLDWDYADIVQYFENHFADYLAEKKDWSYLLSLRPEDDPYWDKEEDYDIFSLGNYYLEDREAWLDFNENKFLKDITPAQKPDYDREYLAESKVPIEDEEIYIKDDKSYWNEVEEIDENHYLNLDPADIMEEHYMLLDPEERWQMEDEDRMCQ